MLKSELILKIQKRYPSLNFNDIEKIVDLFFKEITKALIEGRRTEIRGFGAFFIKEREKRTGLNPKDGSKIEIGKKLYPKFKMGKILFNKLNSKN